MRLQNRRGSNELLKSRNQAESLQACSRGLDDCYKDPCLSTSEVYDGPSSLQSNIYAFSPLALSRTCWKATVAAFHRLCFSFFCCSNACFGPCKAYMPACKAYMSTCNAYMPVCIAYTGTCNAYTTSCIAYKSSCNAYMSIRIAYMRACNAYMSSCIAYTCTSKRRRSFCKSEDLRCASTYIFYQTAVSWIDRLNLPDRYDRPLDLTLLEKLNFCHQQVKSFFIK